MNHCFHCYCACVTIAVAALCLTSLSTARTLHMGAGQSYANIQVAAAASQPGDTVQVHAGVYAGYQFVANWHGAPGLPIVITRYQQDTMNIRGGWQFSMCSYLRFEHLIFRANAQYPGRLFHVENGGSCATQSHHIVVDSCSFFDAADSANSAFKFGGVDTFTVRRCHFLRGAAGAFDFNACHAGLISENRIENVVTGGHIKGGASFITMERNTFVNASVSTWVAFELGGDTGAQFYCPGSTTEVTDLNFYSNVIIGGYRGLALSSAVNCNVVNNTFYSCGQATMRFLTTSTHYPALRGNRVVNNLFVFGGASQYMNGGPQPAGAAWFARNIYYSLVSPVFNGPYWDTPALDSTRDRDPINLGSHAPMFVDTAAHDFHLVDSSIAIGAGADVAEPTVDYNGEYFHIPHSIGAVEFRGLPAGVREPVRSVPDVTIYPNPASNMISVHAGGKDRMTIRLFTTMGQDITPNGNVQNPTSFDLTRIPAGVYFVRCVTATGTNVQQLVVVK